MSKLITSSELQQELTYYFGAINNLTYQLFGNEDRMPMKFEDVEDIEKQRELIIWHAFNVLYDYAVNNNWDPMHPLTSRVLTEDDEPTAIASAFLGMVDLAIKYTPFDSCDEMEERSPSTSKCQRLINICNARRKIDLTLAEEVADNLTVDELAALANMEIGSIRNSISRDELSSNSGAILPSAALEWLKAKGRYISTTFNTSIEDLGPKVTTPSDLAEIILTAASQQSISNEEVSDLLGWNPDFVIENGNGSIVRRDYEHVWEIDKWKKLADKLCLNEKWLIYSALSLSDYPKNNIATVLLHFERPNAIDRLMIPTASDGSSFLPHIRTRNGYRVGKKGNEVLYSNYWQALDALMEMPTPYWRRPNKETGAMGIVRGLAMKEFEREFIESQFENY